MEAKLEAKLKQKVSYYKDPTCDDDEEEEEDICGFACFVVGIIFLFVIVGGVATLIVMGVDEKQAIMTLTSTHPAQPLSSGVLEAIQNSATMNSRVIDDTPNTTKDIGTLDLVILVHSMAEASSKRDLIRHTWMKDTPSKVKVFFVIPARHALPEIIVALKQESKTHKDMVVFLDGPVIPESETLLLELVWSERTLKFLYLMKTRDSMYIRIPSLMQNVVQTLIDVESNAYLGYFQGQQKPRDKRSTKHSEPNWHLCDTFIRFAHSGGYILSKILVNRLSFQGSFLYPYNNEDVALGTWLSPYNDIDWTHNVLFNTEVGKSRGCRNNWIVFSSSDMMAEHKRLQNGENLCLAEREDFPTYMYNFHTFPSKCCTQVKF